MIYDLRSKTFSSYVCTTYLPDVGFHANHFKAKYEHIFNRCPEMPEYIDLLSSMVGIENSILMKLGPRPDTGFFEHGFELAAGLVSSCEHLRENKSIPSKIWSRPPKFDPVSAVSDIAADAGLPAYFLNAFLTGTKLQTQAWQAVTGAVMAATLHEQYSQRPGVYFFTNTGDKQLVKSLAVGFACNQGSGIIETREGDQIQCPAVLLFVRDDYFQVPAVRNEAHLRSLLAPLLGLDDRSMNEECAICLEDIAATSMASSLHTTAVQPFLCGHTFCFQCTRSQLSTCPSCRCDERTPTLKAGVIRSELVTRLRSAACV